MLRLLKNECRKKMKSTRVINVISTAKECLVYKFAFKD